MSRIVELQDGLIKDPAYVHEFAKLEEELAKLKMLAASQAGTAPPARAKRKRSDASTPGQRSA